MKLLSYLAAACMLIILSSCVDIIDDITVNNDGSGTFKYSVNLSASRMKINSILALDTIDGKKVPNIAEIEERIQAVKHKLAAKPGISAVSVETNYSDYIFKIQCNFTSVGALQTAVKEVVKEEMKDKNTNELAHNWLSWDGQKLVRSVPEITFNRLNNLKSEEIEQLKQGKYTSISRFQRTVDKTDNAEAVLAKNKMAVMVRTSIYSLLENPSLLGNTIYLSPVKE